MINSRGPNIEPWGTPDISGEDCDLKFLNSFSKIQTDRIVNK